MRDSSPLISVQANPPSPLYKRVPNPPGPLHKGGVKSPPALFKKRGLSVLRGKIGSSVTLVAGVGKMC